jgi:hypothetical protein
MAHGILTPQALGKVTGICTQALVAKVHLALPPDAIQALIDEIKVLRAHVLHLLPANRDEQPEARDAVAHLRQACGRAAADQLLLAAGLVVADPDPDPQPSPMTIIDPGDSEGGAP